MAKPTLHFQRFEFKYFLPKSQARPLVAALLPYMNWDPYARETGKGYYRVNSLYFDTADYACFWDKEAGVADRKKLRLRYYGDALQNDSVVYAEIKRKKDALVIKDRLTVKPTEAAPQNFRRKLHELYKAEPGREFHREIYWFLQRNNLRPKLFVSYARTALLAKRNKEFRVTVDEDIVASLQRDLGKHAIRVASLFPNTASHSPPSTLILTKIIINQFNHNKAHTTDRH